MNNFDELYCLYRRTLLLYLYSLCKDWCIAEDLVQDTFIKAYINRHRLAHIKYPLIWLRTIARNQYIDYIRRQHIRTTPLDEVEHLVALNFDNDELSCVDLNIFIKEMVCNGLSYSMFLDYLHGYDYDQLSLKYARSLSAVKTRIYRTRKLVQLQWNTC